MTGGAPPQNKPPVQKSGGSSGSSNSGGGFFGFIKKAATTVGHVAVGAAKWVDKNKGTIAKGIAIGAAATAGFAVGGPAGAIAAGAGTAALINAGSQVVKNKGFSNFSFKSLAVDTAVGAASGLAPGIGSIAAKTAGSVVADTALSTGLKTGITAAAQAGAEGAAFGGSSGAGTLTSDAVHGNLNAGTFGRVLKSTAIGAGTGALTGLTGRGIKLGDTGTGNAGSANPFKLTDPPATSAGKTGAPTPIDNFRLKTTGQISPRIQNNITGKAVAEPGYQLTMLNPNDLKPGAFTPPARVETPARVAGVKSFITGKLNNPGQNFSAPVVSNLVRNPDGSISRISFFNGNHRFMVMLNGGMTQIPINIPPSLQS